MTMYTNAGEIMRINIQSCLFAQTTIGLGTKLARKFKIAHCRAMNAALLKSKFTFTLHVQLLRIVNNNNTRTVP